MIKKDLTIIFIHGYNASSKKDWFQDVAKAMSEKGIESVIPDMPGGENPHANSWIETIHSIVAKIHTPIIFVGHSLGCRAILLYLEKYPIQTKAVFLIATHTNTTEIPNEGVHKDFWKHVIDTEKIKKIVEKFVIMHSKDDPVIPYENASSLSKELDAKLLTYENRIHFSTSRNAPYIIEVLKKEIPF